MFTVTGEMTNDEDVRRILDQTLNYYNKLDILVSLASMYMYITFFKTFFVHIVVSVLILFPSWVKISTSLLCNCYMMSGNTVFAQPDWPSRILWD